MLQIVNGELSFPLHKVIYKQRGKTMEDYTNDPKWWEDFAAKWKHTEIIGFETPEFTDEQHQRLEEVKDLDEAYMHYAEDYVLTGLFPNEVSNEGEKVLDHPLRVLQLEKENQMLGQSLTEAEIKNFLLESDMGHLGQQVTGLELQILMQGME